MENGRKFRDSTMYTHVEKKLNITRIHSVPIIIREKKINYGDNDFAYCFFINQFK